MKYEDKKLLIIMILSIPGLIWSGFVITKLWIWFVVPLGLPVISISHAIGIDLIITFMCGHAVDPKNKKILTTIIESITRPAVILFIGFISQLFI